MNELVKYGYGVIEKNYNLLTSLEQNAIKYFEERLFILDHSHMLDDLTDQKELEFLKQCKFYYISDANSYLNIHELHEKIKNTTSFNKKAIKVTNCIMVHESIFTMDINDVDLSDDGPTRFVLRFFITNEPPKIHHQDVVELLEQNIKIKSATSSSDNNGFCSGYGYIYFDSLEKMLQYQHTTHIFNNLEFYFDKL
jgi:hypothetical protein